jgi:hypothetical protein
MALWSPLNPANDFMRLMILTIAHVAPFLAMTELKAK